jgi:hypothetical protein
MPPTHLIADFRERRRLRASSIRDGAALLVVFLGFWLFASPETFLTAIHSLVR